jgi:hypothetical protein
MKPGKEDYCIHFILPPPAMRALSNKKMVLITRQALDHLYGASPGEYDPEIPKMILILDHPLL